MSLYRPIGKAQPENLRQRVLRNRRTHSVGAKSQDHVARLWRKDRAIRDRPHDQRRLARARAANQKRVPLRPAQQEFCLLLSLRQRESGSRRGRRGIAPILHLRAGGSVTVLSWSRPKPRRKKGKCCQRQDRRRYASAIFTARNPRTVLSTSKLTAWLS